MPTNGAAIPPPTPPARLPIAPLYRPASAPEPGTVLAPRRMRPAARADPPSRAVTGSAAASGRRAPARGSAAAWSRACWQSHWHVTAAVQRAPAPGTAAECHQPTERSHKFGREGVGTMNPYSARATSPVLIPPTLVEPHRVGPLFCLPGDLTLPPGDPLPLPPNPPILLPGWWSIYAVRLTSPPPSRVKKISSSSLKPHHSAPP